MATTQKQASIGRLVTLDPDKAGYTGYLHSSTGDVIQEWDDEGNFYPEITPADPLRVQFTATSTKTQGVVTPDSISYKIGGTALSFDLNGKCTTSADAEKIFKLDGADLLIIGPIAQYLGYMSSIIYAMGKKDMEDIPSSCLVNISKRVGGRRQKVSIAPADEKNFTLTSQTDSIKMKAGVLQKAGWVYNSLNYIYIWEIADATAPTGWRCLQIGSGIWGTLTLHASQVHTFAQIRCTVLINLGGSSYKGDASTYDETKIIKGNIVGSDCVPVLDASDPLDIICSIMINKTGTGAEEEADEERLSATMPDAAYLRWIPTIVVRGTQAPVGATKWLPGLLTDPAGVKIMNVPPDKPDENSYTVRVGDMKPHYGRHMLTMTGELI